MSHEMIIYDCYSNDYSLDEWSRRSYAAAQATIDGLPVKFDEYQGQPLAWILFDTEADAALFKLKYL